MIRVSSQLGKGPSGPAPILNVDKSMSRHHLGGSFYISARLFRRFTPPPFPRRILRRQSAASLFRSAVFLSIFAGTPNVSVSGSILILMTLAAEVAVRPITGRSMAAGRSAPTPAPPAAHITALNLIARLRKNMRGQPGSTGAGHIRTHAGMRGAETSICPSSSPPPPTALSGRPERATPATSARGAAPPSRPAPRPDATSGRTGPETSC